MKVLTGASEVPLSRPEAFRAFYAEALPRVYTYLFHRCGGVASVAEDITQETFLAAVGEISKGKHVAFPLPWVLGIARHKLVDHYRRQKQEARQATVSWEAQGGDEQLLTLDENESRERALATLRLLPAPQRAALVFRYLDGMSVSEVASALRKSVRAAESLLVRGRENFRRIYLQSLEASND